LRNRKGMDPSIADTLNPFIGDILPKALNPKTVAALSRYFFGGFL